MASKKTGLQGTEAQAQTRTLLTLWDLGREKAEVKKSEVTKRVTRTNEKAGDYQSIFEKLEKDGAIAIATKNRVANVSLTDKGLQMLGEGLKNSEFEFEGTQVGSRVANALLKWIRDVNGAAIAPAESGKGKKSKIASYEDFKMVALEVYDRLNRDYNLDDLVPIYRIRREIDGGVTREHFNEWLLEMQENDIFQLMAGEMPDLTSDKREDSITIPGAGLRYYAKRLS